jgi:hypothetical protein
VKRIAERYLVLQSARAIDVNGHAAGGIAADHAGVRETRRHCVTRALAAGVGSGRLLTSLPVRSRSRAVALSYLAVCTAAALIGLALSESQGDRPRDAARRPRIGCTTGTIEHGRSPRAAAAVMRSPHHCAHSPFASTQSRRTMLDNSRCSTLGSFCAPMEAPRPGVVGRDESVDTLIDRRRATGRRPRAVGCSPR